jgi:hypothetical protein
MKVIVFFKKKVARVGERTRVFSISFIFSFSPLYRRAPAAPYESHCLCEKAFKEEDS